MRRRSEGERGAALGAEGSGAQTVGALRSLWAGRPEGERGETSLLGNGGQSRHRTAGLEGAFRSVSSQPSAIGGDTARQSSARRPTRPERFQGGGTAAALSGEWQRPKGPDPLFGAAWGGCRSCPVLLPVPLSCIPCALSLYSCRVSLPRAPVVCSCPVPGGQSRIWHFPMLSTALPLPHPTLPSLWSL